MSNPRFDWWTYVCGMIRRFPALKAEHDDALRSSVTANYNGMPGGGGDGHALENQVIREMSRTHDKEYEAVKATIDYTRHMATGLERLELIDMVYWQDPAYKLYETLPKLHIEWSTARRWHRDFVYSVARAYGLMD